MSDPTEKWPESAAERVRELRLVDGPLSPDMKVIYIWDHGGETLEEWRDGGGSSHYNGVFHPNDGLCVGNPCNFCGMVWHEQRGTEGEENH